MASLNRDVLSAKYKLGFKGTVPKKKKKVKYLTNTLILITYLHDNILDTLS